MITRKRERESWEEAKQNVYYWIQNESMNLEQEKNLYRISLKLRTKYNFVHFFLKLLKKLI